MRKSSLQMPMALCIFVLGIAMILYAFHLRRRVGQECARLSRPDVHQKFGAREGSGSPPPVFLIHGYGSTPYDFEPLIQAIRHRGRAFRSILLPGHGTSPRQLQGITHTEWLTATRASLAELAEIHGPVPVVGFSLGGALALTVASDTLVDRLVLINPYFRARRRLYSWAAPEFWAKVLAPIMPFYELRQAGRINNPEGLRVYDKYRVMPTRTVAELHVTGRLAMNAARNLRLPVLWMHSVGDAVVDIPTSHEVFESVPDPRKRLRTFNRSNHHLLYDYDAPEAIQEILDFLKVE